MGEHGLRVSAPANLLLLGEYAVLEEGGLGLAVAPEARARGVARAVRASGRGSGMLADNGPPHPVSRVRGVTPAETLVWPGDTGILGGVADRLERVLGALHEPREIEIDTRALFRADGRKRGFGSSAALTVVLTALWSRLAGSADPGATFDEDFLHLAIDAHRAAQGGRGSGYDVATSVTGGFVLFTGGAVPRARRVRLPWLPPLAIFPGPDPVATGGAVARYRAWATSHPVDHATFVGRSNELVTTFICAGTWAEALPVFAEYRALTVELGERIGVSARIESAPRALDHPGTEAKAVGAGNELGVALLGGSTNSPAGLEPLKVASEGVRWE